VKHPNAPSVAMLALGIVLVITAGMVPRPGTNGGTMEPARAAALCEATVQHPLVVRAEALDPVARGEILQVAVELRGRRGASGARIRVADTGGAELLSASSREVGPIFPDRPGRAEFTVRIPERGDRFLLQFTAEADTDEGSIRRGGSLNLLPDGPHDPGTPGPESGDEAVIEYAAREVLR